VEVSYKIGNQVLVLVVVDSIRENVVVRGPAINGINPLQGWLHRKFVVAVVVMVLVAAVPLLLP